MIKSFFVQIQWLGLGILCLVSACEKEKPAKFKAEDGIQAYKDWVEEDQELCSEFKIRDRAEVIYANMELNWSLATKIQDKHKLWVEVPIQLMGNKSLDFDQTHLRLIPINQRNFASHIRLLIEEDRMTKERSIFYYVVMSPSNLALHRPEGLSCEGYVNKSTDFTGFTLLYHVNGDFIRGHHFENGQITGPFIDFQ